MKYKVDKKNEAYNSKGMTQHKSDQGKSQDQADVRDKELRTVGSPNRDKKPEMGKKSKDQASKETASMSTGRCMGKSGKGKAEEATKAEAGSTLGKPQGSDYKNPAKSNKNDRY